jgi:hypothetical protein
MHRGDGDAIRCAPQQHYGWQAMNVVGGQKSKKKHSHTVYAKKARGSGKIEDFYIFCRLSKYHTTVYF